MLKFKNWIKSNKINIWNDDNENSAYWWVVEWLRLLLNLILFILVRHTSNYIWDLITPSSVIDNVKKKMHLKMAVIDRSM
jgi:hypothetical protein